jgi:hypothetical protein
MTVVGWRMKGWTVAGVVALAVVTCLAGTGRADEAVLTIDLGSGPQRYTAAALLARPDATRITVPNDVSYGPAPNSRTALPGSMSFAMCAVLESQSGLKLASYQRAWLVLAMSSRDHLHRDRSTTAVGWGR